MPVSTAADVVSSRQLEARHYWIDVERPDQPEACYRAPGAAVRLSATPMRSGRRPPRAGEHTAEVLGASRPRAGKAQRATAPAASRAPLAGLRVADFTWVVVGPSSVRYLSDYGATVVHLETGTRIDPIRSYAPFKDGVPGTERGAQYHNVMAGKLGITLNLNTAEGRAVAHRLASWADVVVENYAPTAMRKWGLDYAALRQQNPGLIMVSTCLNGQDGPEADLAGFGTMGSALSGFHELTGWPDRAPAGPFMAYTDYIAPRYMVASILAALDHRQRTGEGQYIDLAQGEAAVQLLAPATLDYTVNHRTPTRMGNRDLQFAPHGVYPCAGTDRWVAVAVETDAQWRSLCDAIARPDWAASPELGTASGRLKRVDALDVHWPRGRRIEARTTSSRRSRAVGSRCIA